MSTPKYLVTISTQTIFKILLTIFIIAFLYLIKEVLAIVFVAILLSSAIDPLVRWLSAKGLPRSLSVTCLYAVLAVLVFLVIFFFLPPLTQEIKLVSENFPKYYAQFKDSASYFLSGVGLNDNKDWLDYFSQSTNAFGRLFTTVYDVLKAVLSLVIILVVTFYFTVTEGMKNLLTSVTPAKYLPYATNLLARIQTRLGQWLRGQLIASLVIFGVVSLGLTLVGVPYALLLGLVAGLLEIVPFIGPMIAGFLAVLFALTVSPFTALIVLIFFIVVQQLENHVLIPQIMGRSVGLNPLLVIVVALIGGKLAGVWGILLAVPVTSALAIFFGDLFEQRLSEDRQLEV